MSSRIFQNVIIQMRDALDRPIGVIDDQGFVVASSELAIIGSRLDDFHLYELENAPQPQLYTTSNRTYFPLSSGSGRTEFVTFVEGTDQSARMICTMASVAFNEAKNNYEEKHNKAAFVKNIISDNILPGDVYVRANRTRTPTAPRSRSSSVFSPTSRTTSSSTSTNRISPSSRPSPTRRTARRRARPPSSSKKPCGTSSA